MLFIRTDDLKPGMRLAKPIYNKLGVMPNRFRHYPTRILLSNSSRPFPCSSFATAWI